MVSPVDLAEDCFRLMEDEIPKSTQDHDTEISIVFPSPTFAGLEWKKHFIEICRTKTWPWRLVRHTFEMNYPGMSNYYMNTFLFAKKDFFDFTL